MDKVDSYGDFVFSCLFDVTESDRTPEFLLWEFNAIVCSEKKTLSRTRRYTDKAYITLTWAFNIT